MELDFSSQAKEGELLFIFRSLTDDQQLTLLAMGRGAYRNLAGEQPLEAAPPCRVH